MAGEKTAHVQVHFWPMFIVCQYYPVTTLELNLSVLRVLFAAKDMQRILVALYMHVYARNLSIKESCMQGIYLSRNRICRLDTTKCSRCTSLDLLEVQFTALSGITFVSVFAISRLSTNLSSPPRMCSFTAVSDVGLG